MEPSASRQAQRPAGLAAAMGAAAEDLPFAAAAMTTFSVHQWGDLRAGVELRQRRCARPLHPRPEPRHGRWDVG